MNIKEGDKMMMTKEKKKSKEICRICLLEKHIDGDTGVCYDCNRGHI